jgi:hypothetical protein
MLVSMYTSHLSFQTNAVKLLLIFTRMSPLSISVFSVQSQGVCVFCLAVPYCMSLFSLSVSHLKVLAITEMSKNNFCPTSSTQHVKCLRVACVIVMLSVAECESLPKYTCISYM